MENTTVIMAKTEEMAVRTASNGKKRRTKVMGEKIMVEKVMVMVEKVMVMVEKMELVPDANQAGRIQEIEAKYICLQ